ncbi:MULTISPECIES: YifB family Mg chelatase-like AAA ATPase [Sulfurimonas]|uniref:YifB family Mg chelatase-like AAA ATPase n=1 Tax=Sulfurimonas diazotrophicus TaxID=3131939 RepID=A0ABZ3H9V3_9BACT
MKQLKCATLEGIDALPVTVESTLTRGLPSFTVVGLASSSISEARERVKSALLANDFTFPPKRITINLSPSDVEKHGSQFDLAMALLIALDSSERDFPEWYAFGELGLDGTVKENLLLYPLILSLANRGLLRNALVPMVALDKLSNIPGITFVGAATLKDAIAFFKEEEHTDVRPAVPRPIPFPHQTLQDVRYYYQKRYPEDFREIRGQEVAKRAALISACGMHNLLLEGSPGSGKSMIAKRLRHILPPMTDRELLDIAKLDVLEGRTPHFAPLRPFRAPHHSGTSASIFGGGSHRAQIGEVGLAHNGILFFDELPHFSKQVLEALREPLEDRRIRISRVHSKVEYPTDFLFVSAMNPCPCGNLLNDALECRCSDLEIRRYRSRLSDPFLDRIDLYVQMQPVRAEDSASLTSEAMHETVLRVHALQRSRGQQALNGRLDDAGIDAYCRLDAESGTLLSQAVQRFALSFRAIKKIQRVARTIADIEGSPEIATVHLLEALSYRRRA